MLWTSPLLTASRCRPTMVSRQQTAHSSAHAPLSKVPDPQLLIRGELPGPIPPPPLTKVLLASLVLELVLVSGLLCRGK